jgi:hypothetical protein
MIRHIIDDDLDGAVEVLREAAGPTNLPCHGCEGTCEPGCRRGKAGKYCPALHGSLSL